MTTPMPDDATDVTADAACIHRWVLAAAGEGDTLGTCRLCHAVRAFTDARKVRTHQGTLPDTQSATTTGWNAAEAARAEGAQ